LDPVKLPGQHDVILLPLWSPGQNECDTRDLINLCFYLFGGKMINISIKALNSAI